MNLAHPDPMAIVRRHSNVLTNDLVMGGLERPDFEEGHPDVRRFRDRLVRNEQMTCRNLTVEQVIDRHQGWFRLQEKLDNIRGLCTFFYLFGFWMIVQKLKERFNPNPTVFDRYNNANGLTRYNATTSTYEIVTYRCLQYINPNYVYWRGQGPYNSHNVKCSFVKKRSGEKGVLVSTLNKYARVWGRIGEIIDVCTFIYWFRLSDDVFTTLSEYT